METLVDNLRRRVADPELTLRTGRKSGGLAVGRHSDSPLVRRWAKIVEAAWP